MRVLVIGAGLAGLVAATEAQDAGHDVVVGDCVFFAGEHTDGRVGPGGMEGAVKSGHRVARELLA